MWTGIERRVHHNGTLQLPDGLGGRIVVVMTDIDGPKCGATATPHIPSHEGALCHTCRAPEGAEGVWSKRRVPIVKQGGA